MLIDVYFEPDTLDIMIERMISLLGRNRGKFEFCGATCAFLETSIIDHQMPYVRVADLKDTPLQEIDALYEFSAPILRIIGYRFSELKSTRVGDIYDAMLHPVGGALEYTQERESETFWKNPRRWEYCQFVLDELLSIKKSGQIELWRK